MVAGVDEVERLAGRQDLVVDAGRKLRGDVELPAEFTDVGDARCPHQAVAQFDLAAGRERERLVGQVRRRQGLQKGARVRPHQGDHAHRRGHVRGDAVRVRRNVRLEPVEVPHFACGGGDDQEAVFGQARHREIRLDAAALVQPLCVDDAAGLHIDLVGADPAEHPGRVPALQAELRERRLVEQPHVLAHGPMLGGRVVEPVLAPVAVLVARGHALRRVPVRPLPAREFPVAGAGRRQAVVQRRPAHAPRRLELAIRVVHGVEKTQTLGGPFAQVLAVALEGQVAAHVDFPEIGWRMPFENPLGNDLADPARGLDSDRVQAGRDEAVLALGRLADVVADVRREALRAAEELRDLGRLEGRHALPGTAKQRLEVLVVDGDLVEAEVLGDAVHAPGPRVRLEDADDQLARVVPEVRDGVVVPHDGQVRIESVDGIEPDVVVLAGMQRDVDADGGGQLPGPHAGAENDAVGVDVPLVRGDADHTPAGGANGGHRRLLDDPGAGGAGARGQRQRDVRRVRVAVAGNVQSAEQVGRLEQRYAFRDRLRRHHVDLQPEHLRQRRAALEFLEALRVGGDGKGAAAAITRRLAGFPLQASVEFARVAGEVRHRDRLPQLAEQAGGMPGRARANPAALEQQHVGASRAREVVGDRAADHAAADDDHARAARQRGLRRGARRGGWSHDRAAYSSGRGALALPAGGSWSGC